MSENKKSKWNKLGSLRKGKTGSLYIKLDKDATLKGGGTLQLIDPRKSLAAAVESGKMSSEQAEERAGKIPDYIRYDVFLVEE